MSLQKESEKDHKCGGELCIVCGYQEKIKEGEKDYVEEMYKEVIERCIVFEEDESGEVKSALKCCVAKAIANREKEIAEEVKKKRKEPTHSGTGSISWYNQALDEVLLIMKK